MKTQTQEGKVILTMNTQTQEGKVTLTTKTQFQEGQAQIQKQLREVIQDNIQMKIKKTRIIQKRGTDQTGSEVNPKRKTQQKAPQ